MTEESESSVVKGTNQSVSQDLPHNIYVLVSQHQILRNEQAWEGWVEGVGGLIGPLTTSTSPSTSPSPSPENIYLTSPHSLRIWFQGLSRALEVELSVLVLVRDWSPRSGRRLFPSWPRSSRRLRQMAINQNNKLQKLHIMRPNITRRTDGILTSLLLAILPHHHHRLKSSCAKPHTPPLATLVE